MPWPTLGLYLPRGCFSICMGRIDAYVRPLGYEPKVGCHSPQPPSKRPKQDGHLRLCVLVSIGWCWQRFTDRTRTTAVADYVVQPSCATMTPECKVIHTMRKPIGYAHRALYTPPPALGVSCGKFQKGAASSLRTTSGVRRYDRSPMVSAVTGFRDPRATVGEADRDSTSSWRKPLPTQASSGRFEPTVATVKGRIEGVSRPINHC